MGKKYVWQSSHFQYLCQTVEMAYLDFDFNVRLRSQPLQPDFLLRLLCYFGCHSPFVSVARRFDAVAADAPRGAGANLAPLRAIGNEHICGHISMRSRRV